MQIHAAFDSGNIDIVDLTDPRRPVLAIRRDVGDEHMQWFHFRVSGAAGQPMQIVLKNASACSYPNAWEGYQACRSTDGETWVRVNTHYSDGALVIDDKPPTDLVWYAYFAPYSMARLTRTLGRLQDHPEVRVHTLGETIDGRALDMLVIGQPSESRPRLWVIARQHPGETMASFWMEGFLERLLDPDDALARRLLERGTFYVVPHMNPDGGVRGHLRCNAAGANLNREWHAPTLDRSPEVLHTRNAMDETGVDFCLDVHGDEALPYNFIAGAEGIAGWNPRMAELDRRFRDAYERACPDFQQVHGYPVDAPGEANMTMCTNAVAQRFDCLAMTLEMPFKDNADAPDPIFGWSPARCQRLGAASVDAMAEVLDDLRAR